MTTHRIDDVQRMLATAWRACVDNASAEFIADATVRTALRKDARFDPIREALEDLKVCKERGYKAATLERQTLTGGLFNLNALPGLAFTKELCSFAILTARRTGVALLGIKNSSGVHQLSTWVEPIARENCIGVFMWNGGSYTTVPYGSREPFFGTNPIAYALPAGADDIVCDMATSEIGFMTLNYLKRMGKRLGPRQGLDSDGRFTDDPAEVYKPSVNEHVRLVPMGGGHKGSSLMLLVEVLTGALVGAKMGREATDDPWTPEEFGGLLIAIDIAALSSLTAFESSLSKLASDIRGSLPAQGFSSVLLPGDGALQRERTQRVNGTMTVAPDTMAALQSMI